MQGYDFTGLSKEGPLKALTVGRRGTGGRNNHGRVTAPHRGGGVKRLLRDVDFKQMKYDVTAKVAALEYDPNRTSRIARLHYIDGAKAYILAPGDLKVGDTISISEKAPVRPGNRMKLKNVPQGTEVHNIELQPGRGGQIVRSAGSAAVVLAHDAGMTQVQLPSSENRMISGECYASVGRLSNAEHGLVWLGKAGRSRWLGRRPKVRGTAMNPVDHPHGGGEGRQPTGMPSPKSPWGKPTRGYRTRRNKKSDQYIVRRRSKSGR